MRYRRPYKVRARSYNAASTSGLYADWNLTGNQSPNEAIRWSLPRMRSRSRDLAINNDYAKKFYRMLRTNVIGPNGIKLQMKIQDRPGKLDRAANQNIEGAWKRWGQIKNCTVTRDMSWRDVENLFTETVARDGECLIRKVRGFKNEFRFALQFIDADHLDENMNANLPGGHKIRMGVEVDQWNAPVAYWLLKAHPGDLMPATPANKHERVPADQVIHGYTKDRANQIRGVPWIHSAMTRLHMAGGYEEAELTGARASASKMGFYQETGEGHYTGDDKEDDGDLIQEFSPGTMERLPPGVTFQGFDPGNPSSNFDTFLKRVLMGAASGMGVSYNTLANDLERVNFSSMRQGVLDMRDDWRTIQGWVRQHLHECVFEPWLLMAFLANQVGGLPFAKFDKFNAPTWQPRGWAWVDPKKDVEANVIAVKNGLKSRTEILAETGQDYEDVLQKLAAEEALAEQMGVSLDDSAPAATPGKNEENEPEKEGENDE